MTETETPVVPVPKSVKAARLAMWAQILLSVIAIATLVFFFDELTDSHLGDEADAELRTAVTVALTLSALSTVALAVCAVLLTRRWKWVFYLTVVVELLTILDKLITLSAGFNVQILIGIALALVVLIRLSAQESRDYLLRPDE